MRSGFMCNPDFLVELRRKGFINRYSMFIARYLSRMNNRLSNVKTPLWNTIISVIWVYGRNIQQLSYIPRNFLNRYCRDSCVKRHKEKYPQTGFPARRYYRMFRYASGQFNVPNKRFINCKKYLYLYFALLWQLSRFLKELLPACFGCTTATEWDLYSLGCINLNQSSAKISLTGQKLSFHIRLDTDSFGFETVRWDLDKKCHFELIRVLRNEVQLFRLRFITFVAALARGDGNLQCLHRVSFTYHTEKVLESFSVTVRFKVARRWQEAYRPDLLRLTTLLCITQVVVGESVNSTIIG